mgnify:FL=1
MPLDELSESFTIKPLSNMPYCDDDCVLDDIDGEDLTYRLFQTDMEIDGELRRYWFWMLESVFNDGECPDICLPHCAYMVLTEHKQAVNAALFQAGTILLSNN